jgi:hypothetical protein
MVPRGRPRDHGHFDLRRLMRSAEARPPDRARGAVVHSPDDEHPDRVKPA